MASLAVGRYRYVGEPGCGVEPDCPRIATVILPDRRYACADHALEWVAVHRKEAKA